MSKSFHMSAVGCGAAVALFAALAVATLVPRAFADDASDDDLQAFAAKCEAERQDYFAALEYRADFSFRRQAFPSEQAARNASLDPKDEILFGFLAKKDKNVRLNLESESPKRGAYAVSSCVASDSVANDRVVATFFPADAGGRASTGSYALATSHDLLQTLPALRQNATPLALCGAPLDRATEIGDEGEIKPTRVLTLDDKRRKLFYLGKTSSGRSFVKEVVVRELSASRSVVEEIAYRFYSDAGREISASILVAVEWQTLDGNLIASRVRSIFGRPGASSDRDAWLVGEFAALDLAKRRPNRYDFILNFKSGQDVENPQHDPENGLVELDFAKESDFPQGRAITFANGLRSSR